MPSAADGHCWIPQVGGHCFGGGHRAQQLLKSWVTTSLVIEVREENVIGVEVYKGTMKRKGCLETHTRERSGGGGEMRET